MQSSELGGFAHELQMYLRDGDIRVFYAAAEHQAQKRVYDAEGQDEHRHGDRNIQRVMQAAAVLQRNGPYRAAEQRRNREEYKTAAQELFLAAVSDKRHEHSRGELDGRERKKAQVRENACRGKARSEQGAEKIPPSAQLDAADACGA